MFDAVNGLYYWAEGNHVDAALSFAAVVPVVGSMATGGRFVTRNLDVVSDSVRVTSRSAPAGVAALPTTVRRGFDNLAGFSRTKVDNFRGAMRRSDGTTNVAGGSRASRGASCAVNSFVPGTQVLMADGTTTPIEDIKLGDLVWATDPETGEEGPREVTRLIEGYGTKTLVDIEIDGEVVTATDGHPIWVNQAGEWRDADEVQAGDLLLTPDGVTLAVDDVEVRDVVDQTVHNLTVDGIHTYYVTAGDQSVLTHNCGGSSRPDLPEGYHYRGSGGSTQVVRNPGRAADLPLLHLEDGVLKPGRSPGVGRSSAERTAFLRSLADHVSTPSWQRGWLRAGRTPPGYAVDHRVALFDGGADAADNMRVVLSADHVTRHRYYRPGGRVPSINGG